jgi:hypothetical protein
MQTTTQVLALALAFSSTTTPANVAPPESPVVDTTATPTSEANATPSVAPPAQNVCIDDEERARALAARRKEAFSSSTIPLGPFYWASADRTFTQAMLVYWRLLDLEEGTRLTLTAPLFAESCTPESLTTMGPLGLLAWREDADGQAGYMGPYFFRRDATTTTNAVLPVYFSSTEEQAGEITREIFVLGPAYTLKGQSSALRGVFPFYATYRDETGYFADLLLPIAFRYGDAQGQRFVVGQTFGGISQEEWWVHSLGVIYAAQAADGSSSTLSIPLLALYSSDQEFAGVTTRTRLMGPVYFSDDSGGRMTFLSPLYARTRDGTGSGLDLAPLLMAGRVVVDGVGQATAIGPLYDVSFFGRRSRGLVGLFHDGAIPGLFLVGDALPKPASDLLTADTEARIVPPLFFARLENDRARAAAFGPSYRIVTEDGVHQGVLPLALSGRATDGALYDVVPPLLFARFIDGEDRTVIAGPTYRMQTATTDHLGVVGLFSSINAPGDHVFIAPGFARFADAARTGEGTRERIFVLQTYLDRTPETQTVASAPFYYWSHDDKTGDFVRVVPPLLAAEWREAGVRRKVLPLYTDIEDANGIDQLFFPFVLTGRAKPGRTTTPLLAFVENEALAPMIGTSNARDIIGGGERAYFIAPLLASAHVEDDSLSATLVGQTYVMSEKNGNRHFGSAPFYFGGTSSSGAQYHLIPPLLSGFIVDEQGGTTVAMAYYRVESATRLDTGVAPLFFHGRDSDGDGYTVAPPLAFVHVDDTHGQKLVAGPFFYVDDDRVGRFHGILPLYLSSETRGLHAFVAPGVIRFADGETDTLVALQTFAQHRGANAGTFVSVPFYLRHRSETGSALDVMPGALSARYIDADGARTQLAGPAFDVTGAHGQVRGIAPLFVDVNYDGGHTLATPLFIDYTFEDQHALVTPAFVHAKSDNARMLLTPAVIDLENDDGRTTVAPFFARVARDTETTMLIAQTMTTLSNHAWSVSSVPFYFGRVDTRARRQSHVVPLALAAMWGDTSDVENAETNMVLGPVYRSTSTGGQELAVAPFVFTGVGDSTPLKPRIIESVENTVGFGLASPLEHGPYAYTIVPPLLFAHLASDDGTETTTLIGQTLHHRSKERTLFHTAPFYYGEDTAQGSSHLVPLLLSGTGEDREKGASTTVVAPLLYAHTKDRAHETRLAGPWFSHDDEKGHAMRVLAPVYVDAENERGFFRMLTPLLFVWGDDEASHMIAPGMLARRTKEGHDTVALPLFVDVERPQLSLRVIAGMFWSLSWQKDEERRALSLAPGYVRYEDDEEVIEVAGVVGWSRGKGDSTSWSWHLEPIGSVSSYREGHLRIRGLLGLFRYEREGDRQQVTVLGIGGDPT